uniref:Uncharacterized protein n=1 Tax=Arundo donax TaxID=35708 RepID=A0A0A9ANX2_ARUDO
MVYVPGKMGKRVGYIFHGGDLVYSTTVLAPLCGNVHKRRVYICELFENGWIPDPCKVCLFLEVEF